MEVNEAKEKFIQAWGTLGSNWGINRTMAQIHALLLVSPEPISTEEVMESLNVSRGNVNMNIRTLIDWGLVEKVIKAGERKEFFVAEKDIWVVARQIAKQRKKRELEPLAKVIEQLQEVKLEGNDAQTEEFKKVMKDIGHFSGKAESLIDTFIKADQHWLYKYFLK